MKSSQNCAAQRHGSSSDRALTDGWAYLPYVNISAGFVLRPGRALVIHDLHLQARRECSGSDFCATFQLQPLPVSEREEQVVDADVVDDETCAASAELPLATRSSNSSIHNLCDDEVCGRRVCACGGAGGQWPCWDRRRNKSQLGHFATESKRKVVSPADSLPHASQMRSATDSPRGIDRVPSPNEGWSLCTGPARGSSLSCGQVEWVFGTVPFSSSLRIASNIMMIIASLLCQ
jgi:hypothetical protein